MKGCCYFCRGRYICKAVGEEKAKMLCGGINTPKDVVENGLLGIDLGKEEIKVWISELLDYAIGYKGDGIYE